MKVSITNILFATSLSPSMKFAMCYAAELARMTNAEIHVLHVIEPLSDDARVTLEMFVLNSSTRKQALERRADMQKQVLNQRQDEFWDAVEAEDKHVRDRITSMEVIEGNPADVILRRAKELGCDMIVMGAHDHAFTHTFLGTVSKRVLRRSNIPTLIVPHPKTP
ncbi:universal stress protein [Jannaschia rubra]|uniref:Stress response protein NhaX n=1 Tax=Jannaschia rubra TaxID=282197 RepID=A0A0M6XLG4_9RHOB|nr:universal stress protein [Jannaschia rubra]CTQ31986.1 Stress response protein NhaX [Jannaschia rubra]SFG40556.1 Nucleotide-binding universal stress protein, UspA family [Jannaschia rubra]